MFLFFDSCAENATGGLQNISAVCWFALFLVTFRSSLFFACLYEGHMAVCPYSCGTCKGSYNVYSAGMMGTILRLNDAAWN